MDFLNNKETAPRFLTILTGRNLPKIRQSREAEPSIINEKTVADFTRVVEQIGILERELAPVPKSCQSALRSPEGDSAGPGQRSDGQCPPSPADDPQTTVIIAGTFISAMFMSGRLPSA